MNISEQKERLITAKKCAESFWFFTRYFFKKRNGFKFIPNWHHIKITNMLTRVYNGEVKRLIINMPPRYGKTEIAVISFIAWCLARNPKCKFIHTSYSKDLALDNSRKTRDLVGSEEYQKLFNVKLSVDVSSKTKWGTEDGGEMYAAGSGGSLTGFGAGLATPGFGGAIIIDDAHKPKDCASDVMRQSVLDWYQSTVQSRTNSPDTPIIIIMQRLHMDDLAGWLLGGGSGEKWEHLCLPAISPDGEALCDRLHNIETLRTMEKANAYVFAGQFMQNPIPGGGAIFKTENFRIVDAIPNNIVRIVRGWDTAGSQGSGDYTAGVKIALLSDGNYIVLDVARGQWKFEAREKEIKNIAQMDGVKVAIKIEQEGGSGGKDQVEFTIKNLAGFAAKATKPTGAKDARAAPFASQVNVGNVFLLKAHWNKEYVDELKNFPFAKHDDQVDASSCAFNELALGRQPTARVLTAR